MVVKLFVTGGAGFVGSHCIAELFNSKDGNGNEINFHIVVVDNMINSVNGKVLSLTILLNGNNHIICTL